MSKNSTSAGPGNSDGPLAVDEPQLLARLAQLPRERATAEDLWPQIQSRLASTAGADVQGGDAGADRSRWSPLSVAAAVAVAFLASVFINLSGESPVTQADRPGHLPLLSASAQLEYSGALQDLLPVTLSEQAAAAGSLLADYEQSLEVVRSATESVRAALQLDPQSRYLNTMLTDLHRRQLLVMRAMARHADVTNPGSTT